MGGTLDKVYNNTCYSLYLNSKAISILQEQSSTGSRINRASDDPATAYQVLGLNSQTISLANYMSTIANVSSTMEIASTMISSMSSIISDTEVNLTKLTSGTYDETSRANLADQINESIKEMVSYANTQNAGKYLFGGANTDSAAYTIEYTDGVITGVSYTGSSKELTVEVAPGVTTASYYVGEDLFSCDDRATPTFYGDTGAAAGSGTSSVTGTAWLEITQDTDGDYCLSIGGDTVDLGSYTGDLSNVPVTNADGEVLYVDASNIIETGTAMITVSGTYDVFNVLISIRDLLNNEEGLSESQLQDYRNAMTDILDEVTNQLVEKTTSIGSKIGFLDDLNNSLEDLSYNTEDQTTLLQEADITQIAIDLARRETLYEMTLSVAGKLLSMTLLDYID